MGKSRARQTLNDAPLPKVNWYLSHICFPLFNILFAPYLFFSTACLKFSKLFSACWNFSSTFFLKQKYQKHFSEFRNLLENEFEHLFEQTLAEHHIFKIFDR